MSDYEKLIIGAIGGGILAVAGMFVADKADVLPPPESPAINAHCPSGWADTSKEVEHAIVLSCEKDEWLVILHSDGTFSHGLQKNTPGAAFVYDPREVRGWPAQ